MVVLRMRWFATNGWTSSKIINMAASQFIAFTVLAGESSFDSFNFCWSFVSQFSCSGGDGFDWGWHASTRINRFRSKSSTWLVQCSSTRVSSKLPFSTSSCRKTFRMSSHVVFLCLSLSIQVGMIFFLVHYLIFPQRMKKKMEKRYFLFRSQFDAYYCVVVFVFETMLDGIYSSTNQSKKHLS